MADVIVAVGNDRERLLDNDEISEELNGVDDKHRGGSEDDESGPRNNGNMEPTRKNAEDIVVCNNVHKTYLLGIEGVAALRWPGHETITSMIVCACAWVMLKFICCSRPWKAIQSTHRFLCACDK